MTTIQTKTRGAVIVTRVSTGEQVKHGTSLESQLETCRVKALELGLPIVAEYEDAGISGSLLVQREGMQSAIADITAGRADTLICASMSRYSRDVEHQQSIRKAVRNAGGAVVFCDIQFDDTPEGDLAFDIFGGFAAYERKVIRERTMRGKRKRAEEGQQPARSQAPYGYAIPTKADVLRGTYPPESLGKYIIIDDRAAVVRQIFGGYASGAYSLPTLSRMLNEQGIRTPRGSEFWHATTLRNILTNTAYKGQPVSGKWRAINDESRIGDSHPINGLPITRARAQVRTSADKWIRLDAPPIVGEDVWDMATERLGRNRSGRGGNPVRVRMLSGRITCPACGGKMISHNSKTHGKVYTYYICRSYLTHRDRSKEDFCTGTVYPIDTIELAVVRAISQACEAPEAVSAALEAYRPRKTIGSSTDIARARQELESQLVDLARDEQAGILAQVEGIKAGASPAAYATVFQKIAETRRATEDKLAQLRKIEAATQVAPTTTTTLCKPSLATKALADVETMLTSDHVCDADKRNAIGLLVDTVVCRKDGADIHFLPSIWTDQTLAITLITSSNSVGLRSRRP